MKVYVAGPMRGCPDLNVQAFDRAKEGLMMCGHIVLSPADNDRLLGIPLDIGEAEAERLFFERRGYARDLEHVMECDAIYMLKGWELSAGARAEHAVAVWLKKDIWYEKAGI